MPVAAAALWLSRPIPACAMPPQKYLAFKRQQHCDPQVTYARVLSDPRTFAGAVFELKGVVEGTVMREGRVTFLLTMPDQQSVCLLCPAPDVDLVSGANRQPLRVLVRVGEAAPGNTPPLEALAVANDALVSLKEQELAAQKASQSRTAATPSGRRPEPALSSRGGFLRTAQVPEGLSPLAARSLTPEAQAIYPAYKQFIARCNSRLSPEELDAITVSVLYFSQRYKVDPRLVVAMIIAESDFNPRSTSRKGAMGLGQLMPEEVRALHLTNPYDPIQNVKGAVDLLRGKLDLFRRQPLPEGQYTWDQIMLALAAYNAGAGAVRRYGGIPPYRETQAYVRRIVRLYRQLCGLQ
ncbi:MAG: lytic transglycosylase domain-containing protein [Chthonomonadales bacterium]